jgi:hypothetical protein
LGSAKARYWSAPGIVLDPPPVIWAWLSPGHTTLFQPVNEAGHGCGGQAGQLS